MEAPHEAVQFELVQSLRSEDRLVASTTSLTITEPDFDLRRHAEGQETLSDLLADVINEMDYL